MSNDPVGLVRRWIAECDYAEFDHSDLGRKAGCRGRTTEPDAFEEADMADGRVTSCFAAERGCA